MKNCNFFFENIGFYLLKTNNITPQHKEIFCLTKPVKGNKLDGRRIYT